ncbi:hypothetical protein [Actinomyces procaprae]|uniref:hypothetical protein n=1 Tax=Actinomyces procaprae TaxID=2560010 RepID=UPI0014453488|nr:hypothetical protein [Actinomyces procaprae]
MTEMKILPVERAIEWIRAWAELDWPITWETAYATRDKLGRTPAPDVYSGRTSHSPSE